MVNDIFGNDIKSDWNFTNGDINLVSGKSNLGQAICNRLNANLNTYDIFYARYGGNLLDYLGESNSPNIHEYIKIEIESILGQDPRIQSSEATVSSIDSTTIEVELKIKTIGRDEIVTLNLIIQDDLMVQINPNVGDLLSRCY